jgi:hypothetical protein
VAVDREHQPAIARQAAIGQIVEGPGQAAADLFLGLVGIDGNGARLQPDPLPGREVDRHHAERRAHQDRAVDSQRKRGGKQRDVLVGKSLPAAFEETAFCRVTRHGYAVAGRQQRTRGSREPVPRRGSARLPPIPFRRRTATDRTEDHVEPAPLLPGRK